MKRKIISLITLFLVVFSACFFGGCKKGESKALNVVITVEFEDTQGFFGQEQTEILKQAFISDENGLKNFIYKNSNRKKTVETVFAKTVKINKPVACFMPRFEYALSENGVWEYMEINPDGYDNRNYTDLGQIDYNGKPSADRFLQEQELLSAVASQVNPKTLGILEEDKIENVTLVFSKLNVGLYQTDMFWPHQARVYSGDKENLSAIYNVGADDPSPTEIKMGDKSVSSYIFIPYAFISNGENVKTTTICHEYMHALGAPDLYRNGEKEFVGEFDIMGGKDTAIPNLSLSYVRYKMGWINEISHVKPLYKSGEYLLRPTENNGGTIAYKITLPDYFDKGESFYIEYRNLGKGSLSTVQTEGVIIYRVNEDKGYLSSSGEESGVWHGNANFEEVSVFRFWRELFGDYEERNQITTMGICNATIFDKPGYTVYGSKVDGEKVNAITYSDGTNSKITVEFLGKTKNGEIKIKVDLPQNGSLPQVEEKLLAKSGNRHVLTFDGNHYGKTAYVLYSNKKIINPKAEKLAEGKLSYPVMKIDTGHLQTTLPKFDGLEKFIYVFYGDENGFTTVKEYHVAGIKNVNLTVILVVALILGVVLPTAILYIKTIISKWRKKHGKSQ